MSQSFQPVESEDQVYSLLNTKELKLAIRDIPTVVQTGGKTANQLLGSNCCLSYYYVLTIDTAPAKHKYTF